MIKKKSAPRDPEERDEALERLLDKVLERLTGAAAAERRAAAQHFYPRFPHGIRVRLFGRLLKMLKSGGAARRGRAADALVQAGAYAAPALLHALLTGRGAAFQARVAEVLGRLGPSLTPESRQEAKLVLRIAIARGKDEGLLLAALKALEALEPGAAAEETRRLLAKVQGAAAGAAPATGPPAPAGR